VRACEVSVDIDRLRQKLRSGALPRGRQGRTWVGRGSARTCMACDAIIARDDIEIECDDAAGRPLRFHKECFDAWETEREAGD
jgi:hypothetical protein